MTVEELIEKLRSMTQDLPVFIQTETSTGFAVGVEEINIYGSPAVCIFEPDEEE